ncbi:hypothetical protein ACIQAC_24340 [Streptomyces sp. NPDC088387]|uniref:hypothetical protein n=1 Tax=Streptomyces sp. NPDC088387 TaxID=3365859 RepID=UPI00380081CF
MGAAVCALILVAVTAVTGNFVLLAYMVQPDGPWDDQAVTNSSASALVALLGCAFQTTLTWLFVSAPWLRKWWYGIPAGLAAAALLRLTWLAPEL